MLKQMGLPNVLRLWPGYDELRDKHMQSDSQKAMGAQKPQPTDLNVEANRLKTFDSWHISFIDKHQLALLGFYYYGPGDMVKCHFCGVEIGMWEHGDDVLTDHMRWSPYCPLIRRNGTKNVPINEALLNKALPPAATLNVYGSSERTNTVSKGFIEAFGEDDIHMFPQQRYTYDGFEAVPNGRQISRPEHPEFALAAKRIDSYEDWPKTMRQKPQQLSDAGFYYTGKGDRVCCFSCGGGMKDWEEIDDPWELHGMWYEKCEYLRLMKGDDFIQQMAQKRKEICNKLEDGKQPEPGFVHHVVPKIEEMCKIANEVAAFFRETKNITKTNPVVPCHPDYILMSERLKTFSTWPKLKAADFAKAGFLYCVQSEKVICFSCGLNLDEWDSIENPYVEHMENLKTPCNHLTDNFIEISAVLKEYWEPYTCKICYQARVSFVCLPCKHVFCGPCAAKINDAKCPYCRIEFEQGHYLFLS